MSEPVGELSQKQIHNMASGIGCANCGNPSVRKFEKYEVCGSKGCMRTLKNIWKANASARRAGR